MGMVIEVIQSKQEQERVITLEQYQKIKERRRRRVAKRLVKVVPLFVVEEMQKEFPGYNYDQFVQDVTRKTRKGKSFRKPKRKSFDWEYLRREIPDFFEKCLSRTPSVAMLRLSLKSGEYIVKVRRVYNGSDMYGFSESFLDEATLIRLWKGVLKDFLKHQAITFEKINNEL